MNCQQSPLWYFLSFLLRLTLSIIMYSYLLTNRLKTCFGIFESAFSLFSSYLSCLTQTVTIGQDYSSELPLLFGIPKGSVLGPQPLLYTLPPLPIATFLMMPP